MPQAAPVGGPLEDLTILALEHVVALPFGTQMLADFGAKVINVEPTWFREDSGSRWRLRTGRNKQRIVVNFKDPRGQKLISDMATKVDVFAENYRPGVMKRYHLDWETLKHVNPRLVYTSVSGFGNDAILPSPFEEAAAYGPIAEAAGGITDTLFGSTPRPTKGGIALGDITSAVFGMVGLLAAVRDRDRTGVGQYVDVAMADCLLALNERSVLGASGATNGGAPTGKGIYMGGTYAAADGCFMLFAYHRGHWEIFCDLLGHKEWIDDPVLNDFHDKARREKAVEEIVRVELQRWASTMTKVEATEELNRAGLPANPVNTPADILDSAHVRARQMIVDVEDEHHRCVPVVGNPIKMSKIDAPDTTHSYRISAPGADTAAVLEELLDLSHDEIASLAHEGVVYLGD